MKRIVVNNRPRTPGHGRVVAYAMLAGATPYEFQTKLRRSVELYRAVDDLERVFEIIYEQGDNQAMREGYSAEM